MNKLELIINEKLAELGRLEKELKGEMWKGNEDFELAALLQPIMWNLRREISLYRKLNAASTPVRAGSFERFLNQLFTGNLRSVQIHITTASVYKPFDGRFISIDRTHTGEVTCTLTYSKNIDDHSFYDLYLLKRLGWKRAPKSSFVFSTGTCIEKDL